jgi:hypothetical protein
MIAQQTTGNLSTILAGGRRAPAGRQVLLTMQSMQNAKEANLLIGAFQADVKQQEVYVSI